MPKKPTPEPLSIDIDQDADLLANFDREARIQSEYDALIACFSDLDGHKQKIAEVLSRQVATLIVEMLIAEAHFSLNGTVEDMQQGKDYTIKRISPYFQVYQQSASSCSTAIKNILSMYPKEDKVKVENELDDLQSFFKRYK